MNGKGVVVCIYILYLYTHTHNGILVIKRNKFETILVRRMKPEPIIQSEVSQKNKNKYHILTHVYGI